MATIAHATAITQLEECIGNTPLIGFQQITANLAPSVSIYAKAEWANPGGSVKDRPAHNIVLEAERMGLLHPGITLLDSSSGNMGIAYAMLGAVRGFRVKLIMPANVSPERIAILRAYGVDLVLSDPLEGTDGAIRLVRQIADSEPDHYFFADQYNNPANVEAHYQTTGPEIWEQTDGEVTHFVAGLGTGGTMTGAGRWLRHMNPTIRLLAVQPDAPFHGLEGLKHMETAIVPGIYDPTVLDGIIRVRTEDAHAMCRRLAREEGILVGVSAGAAMVGALRLAENLREGTIVTIFPDGASKYLSQPFWMEKS
jgi:cysteine synthase B